MDNFVQDQYPVIIDYAAPIVTTLLIMLVSVLVYFMLSRGLKNFAANGYLDNHITVVLGGALKVVLFVTVLLLALAVFGVSVSAIWAVLSGILALVAVGFVAVWSVLSNVLCSVLLIMFAPFRIGDEIEIQEPTANFYIRGKVVSIDMLMTSLEVSKSEDASDDVTIMRVPNNIFFQKYVRCIPGKRTQSLKKYMAGQQEQTKPE